MARALKGPKASAPPGLGDDNEESGSEERASEDACRARTDRQESMTLNRAERFLYFPGDGGRQFGKGGRGGSSRFTGVSWNDGKSANRSYQHARSCGVARKKLRGKNAPDERKYDEAPPKIGRPLNFPAGSDNRAVNGSRGGLSRFKGVSSNRHRNKWRAEITINGKKNYLGNFDDEEEAARKHDEAAARLGRPLNFSGGGDGRGSTTKPPRLAKEEKEDSESDLEDEIDSRGRLCVLGDRKATRRPAKEAAAKGDGAPIDVIRGGSDEKVKDPLKSPSFSKQKQGGAMG